VAGAIARRQAKIANAKLKLDLFDRRCASMAEPSCEDWRWSVVGGRAVRHLARRTLRHVADPPVIPAVDSAVQMLRSINSR
jgi:hypothetical protein